MANLREIYQPDENLFYGCISGFYLKGSNTIICLHNGTWSEPNFICIRKYQPIMIRIWCSYVGNSFKSWCTHTATHPNHANPQDTHTPQPPPPPLPTHTHTNLWDFAPILIKFYIKHHFSKMTTIDLGSSTQVKNRNMLQFLWKYCQSARLVIRIQETA